MNRLVLSLLISAAAIAPALAGQVPAVPAVGSPISIAAAIGGVALVVRLIRRT